MQDIQIDRFHIFLIELPPDRTRASEILRENKSGTGGSHGSKALQTTNHSNEHDTTTEEKKVAT